MNFDVAEPLRIQTQAKADECTSCALAAIAEDVLKVPVDPDYIYKNSSDGTFGITPEQAISAVLNKGILPLGTANAVFPFKDSTRAWPWVFRFNSIVSLMQQNRKSFFCGCYWQDEWTNSSDGIMRPSENPLTLFPHAFKVFGVVEINGTMYLKVQNSFGEAKGDHGIFYAPKETVTQFLFAYQPL